MRDGHVPPRRPEASAALIARARHDRAAFGDLYDLYFRRVYTFCALHSATREEAEDVAAQTFERALAHIGRYEERGAPFSAWLLRIAAHAAADRARRAVHAPVASAAAPHTEDVAAPERTAADEVEQWDLASWLDGHLAALPPAQRRVVRLRFYDGCSFAEVAERMGRSEGAAKQVLRRALGALRARLRAEERDEA